MQDVHRGLTAAAPFTSGTIILVDWYASTENAPSVRDLAKARQHILAHRQFW
jgi:hypothetical protein